MYSFINIFFNILLKKDVIISNLWKFKNELNLIIELLFYDKNRNFYK
jgi:hypothetical protein